MPDTAVYPSLFEVSLKAIAPVEKLADVLANIVLQCENASRMMFVKRCHIDDYFINDSVLSSLVAGLLEFSRSHPTIHLGEGICLPQYALMSYF